jgi:hypothetical protein
VDTVCYSARPASVAAEKHSKIKWLRWQCPQRKLRRSKKEVDEERDILHNLTSLLLTNTTIRTTQQGSTVCLFFKN